MKETKYITKKKSKNLKKKTKIACKLHSVHHSTQRWNLFYTVLKAALPSAFITFNRFNLKSSYDSADVGITNFPSQTAQYIPSPDKSVNSIFFKKGRSSLAVAKEQEARRVSSVTNLWKNCAVDPISSKSLKVFFSFSLKRKIS